MKITFARFRNAGTGSVLIVLGSSVIAAASGFLVLIILAPALGPAEYSIFSAFWSAMFLIVGLFFGIQQETTRAVAAAADESRTERPTNLTKFAAVVSVCLLALTLVTGVFWSAQLFGDSNSHWLIPLSLGVSSYVIVAAINGILAGSGRWQLFALQPILDGLLRLVFVFAAVALDLGTWAVIWAIALPLPISLVVMLALSRKTLSRFGKINESYRKISRNAGRTVAASGSMSILINGLPLLIVIFGRADAATLGTIILALTVTRAPILVPLTAMQSILIAKFSREPAKRAKTLALVSSVLIVITLLIATVFFLSGEWLFVRLFGEDYALSGALLAGMVFASGSLALLTVVAAAALSASLHSYFLASWSVASGGTIVLLAMIPLEIGWRTVISLIASALTGASIAGFSLWRSKWKLRNDEF
jgi:O-antigen/teichoic acid export membrane protein